MIHKHGNALSGALLVAGTCIGAGMLASPVVTGLAGLIPALAVNVACWLFMMATGLLFLEATLWMHDGANLISMSERFFGPVGKIVGWVSFLFLYYCLLVSYFDGVKPMLQSDAPISLIYSGFCLFFFAIVLLGTRYIDRLNLILMAGLVASYVLLVTVGVQDVQPALFSRAKWSLSFMAFPVLFSAYGYHNIIPSIASYLDRNVKALRLAIILGTTLPFLIYALWQALVIGILTEEQLQQAANQGVPITATLHDFTKSPWVSSLALYFGFFALVTSLLGVAMSMVDFLADGLKVERKGKTRLALTLAVFLPPAIFAWLNPGIFLDAIAVAGGIGEALLNGLIPVALVWVGRYKMGLSKENALPGGKPLLFVLALFSLLIMGYEMFILLRHIS